MQTSSRHFQRDLLTVLAWGSVAAALGLWIADGGLQTVTSGAKVLVAGGIVTRLVATDLMVIMLILAARVPYVDRAIGHDRAIALHNKLGKWVLFGLLFHAILTSTSSTSTSITSSAVPTLTSRVVAAQSGSISTVSGAMYTSKAFISSVQSAVTKAKA